ncbi:MAG: bifunctional tetrahydrofolate synthase/dihydrofolate synthase [Desulfobacteraceae bacterium 4572_130]|nr:MAG: bifunctional tetrahydrofolate synthase/dihydrofolate synthase [Desulfobacteraceae bacterium 4572_130]
MEQISYKQCLDKMYKLNRFGIKLELETITNILKNIGSPQKKFKSIHIAGTNGKGSIASYIASILKSAGFKTGLYTSPHLIKFNERFSINGKDVSNDDIVQSYIAVKNADTGKRKATFFELATAMGFYLFARNHVQWAVIETGMGGRLDATNVIKPELSVISNISIEHTDYLGNTIKDIAREKAGIIKNNIPVITGVKQASALSVLRKTAEKKSADFYLYKKDFKTRKSHKGNFFTYTSNKNKFQKLETKLLGPHQIENAALAIAASEIILSESSEKHIKHGILKTTWPARLEYIMDNPMVIIDGAHNFEASKNLGKYLKFELKGKKIAIIIGILDDKPYKSMVKELIPCAHKIIFTKAEINRSLDPKILKDFSKNITDSKIIIIENVGKAVEYAIKNLSDYDCICVAGSLYVAGEAREKIIKDLKS